MQEEIKLYQYSVIRLVPKVEREEFFNVGLILFSKKARYIRMEYHLCPDKFGLLCPEGDYEEIRSILNAMKEIAGGNAASDPIARFDAPERFLWLTAVRSSIIQSSPPHPGRTENLHQTFERLFEELVK